MASCPLGAQAPMYRRLFSATTLRDYQKECIKISLEQFNLHGIKRQAVSLPVGAGKTVPNLELVEFLSNSNFYR